MSKSSFLGTTLVVGKLYNITFLVDNEPRVFKSKLSEIHDDYFSMNCEIKFFAGFPVVGTMTEFIYFDESKNSPKVVKLLPLSDENYLF